MGGNQHRLRQFKHHRFNGNVDSAPLSGDFLPPLLIHARLMRKTRGKNRNHMRKNMMPQQRIHPDMRVGTVATHRETLCRRDKIHQRQHQLAFLSEGLNGTAEVGF